MEFRVHSIQFYDVQPQPINAMSVCRSSHKLAVARGDGSIEIYGVLQDYYLLGRVPGSLLQSVEALEWICGRLFATGLSGYLVEIDVEALRVKSFRSVVGQSAICMTSVDTKIAVGTDVGYVSLYQLEDSNFEVKETLPKLEGRVLCLAWNRQDQMMLASGGEGILHIWNLRHGRVSKKFSIARESTKRVALVWSLAFIRDTLVSGDSQGCVTFWDPIGCGQLQRFHSHRADILTVAVGLGTQSVFASGVDPLVQRFDFHCPAKTKRSEGRWVTSSQLHGHSHDVRALACTRSHVISGGLGSQLILYKVKQKEVGSTRGRYQSSRIWRLPVMPQRPIAQVAGWCSALGGNLLLFRYPGRLELIMLGSTSVKLRSDNRDARRKARKSLKAESNTPEEGVLDQSTSETRLLNDILPLSRSPLKLADILPKPGEEIVASCLASSGRLLAYSDTQRTRLLALDYAIPSDSEEDSTCRVRVNIERFQLPQSGVSSSACSSSSGRDNEEAMSEAGDEDEEMPHELPPAHLLAFTADASHLVMVGAEKGQTLLVNCATGNFEWEFMPGTEEQYSRAHLLAVSPDGQHMALGCVDGLVIIYSIKERKRLFHWKHTDKTLPTAITFHHKENRVLIIYSDKKLFDIDLKTRLPRTWTKNFNSHQPNDWRLLPHITHMEYIIGDRVLMYTSRYVICLDMNRPLPSNQERLFQSSYKKRRMESQPGSIRATSMTGEADHCFKWSLEYKMVLFAGVLNTTDLVVLNIPGDDYFMRLPSALSKKKFGT